MWSLCGDPDLPWPLANGEWYLGLEDKNQPGSWAGGLVWPMQFGNSVPVTILLGLLEVWGTGQFVCSTSPLFQDGLDTQQREREFLISLHLCHRQRFCLPCACWKNRSWLGTFALLCMCQMAWTCSPLGRVTLEVFWEVPEHFPPILHGVL